jgi:hypothetical protein
MLYAQSTVQKIPEMSLGTPEFSFLIPAATNINVLKWEQV